MKRIFLISIILIVIISTGFIPTPKKYTEKVFLKIDNVHQIYSGLIILKSFEIESNKDTITLTINYNTPNSSDYLRVKSQPDNLQPDKNGYYHYSMIDKDCYLNYNKVYEIYSPTLLQVYEVGDVNKNDKIIIHFYDDTIVKLNFLN